MIYSRASHKTIYLQDVPKNGLFDTECHKIFKLQNISKLRKWQTKHFSHSHSLSLFTLSLLFIHITYNTYNTNNANITCNKRQYKIIKNQEKMRGKERGIRRSDLKEM